MSLTSVAHPRRPGRPSRPPLRLFRPGWVLLLLVPGSLPLGGSAQNGPSPAPADEVTGLVGVHAGVVRVGTATIPVGTLAGRLRLTPELEIGGETATSFGRSDFRSPTGIAGSTLGLWHLGATLRWRPAGDAAGLRWAGSVVLGTGSLLLRSPRSGALGTRGNYLFVEPRVHVLARQHTRVRVSLDAGYRVAGDVEGLPGIGPGDLRGPSGSIGIELVRRPAPP